MTQSQYTAGQIRLIDRLQSINQAALGLALALVSVVLIISGLVFSLRALVIEHKSAASVVSENLGAAMLFGDQVAAEEMLRALHHLPYVRFSAIYDKQGKLFSSFSSDVRPTPGAIDDLQESVSFHVEHVQVVWPVTLRDDKLGAIVLEVGLGGVFETLLRQGLVIVGAAMMALYLARRLLGRLSASVLQPIAGLTHVMDEVAERSDFGVRARPCDVEELAHLANGLNGMLEQIQSRDDKLAMHRQQLEKEVAERTLEYLEARDQAEAASRAKSAFLSNMSHEIRTPMNAIVGMANVLRREGVNERQSAHLDMIDTAGAHLLSLINNILDLSKIEAGKIELEEKPVNLRALVGNVSTMLSERAQAKGLKLVVEVGECDALLLGDATRLQQCLVNYLTNAIKFSDRGTITLRVACDPSADDAVGVRFEVADQGIGISPEAIPRLFGMFEQADNTMTRRFGGSGLGLVITRHLARLMGGDAGVESVQNEGSVFWFTAKLARQPSQPENTTALVPEMHVSPDQQLREQFAGRRILVVDDDAMNREVAEMTLQVTGLLVDVAEDGEQAIRMAKETVYAAILMDVQMPVLDGLMATQRIRSLPGCSRVPIVAMTANAFAEDLERCLSVGMNDFLLKPFDPDHLFRVLLKWLGSP